MKSSETYQQKFERICDQTLFHRLAESQQAFLREQACRWRLTLQELKTLCDIAQDLAMWEAPPLSELWPQAPPAGADDRRERKKQILEQLHHHWQQLKAGGPLYPPAPAKTRPVPIKLEVERREKTGLGLGYCPVASTQTRCCNLLTLDAIESCGFDCSYCSIQSFYSQGRIGFDRDFADKLEALQLDPEQSYHIGTGQSSDSLLWGNKYGMLEALLAFARRHPNVILELKTKSDNIAYLLEQDVPANVLCTWSLNTPAIIAHEEHRTATLTERLDAARRIADRGILVGFHLHPMIHYDRWQEDYAALCAALQEHLQPAEVALVSLGTLTFTKTVIRQIRQRGARSNILQMPLVESDGKLSYPKEIKLALFSHAYESLSSWHGKVFFYLCMENHALWRPIFGFEYPCNEHFEQAMKTSYLQRIEQAKMRRAAAQLAHGNSDWS